MQLGAYKKTEMTIQISGKQLSIGNRSCDAYLAPVRYNVSLMPGELLQMYGRLLVLKSATTSSTEINLCQGTIYVYILLKGHT